MKRWLIGVALGCALVASTFCMAHAGSAPVQETTGNVASGTSFTLTFPADVIQGDEVTVFAACAGRSNTLAVSGLGAAVWNLIGSDSAATDPNSPITDLWLAAAPAAAGKMITIDASAAGNCAAHAAEWAGTTGIKDTGDAIDRKSNSFGAYGSPQTSEANDLVIMEVAWAGNATITGAPEGTTGPLRLYAPMIAVHSGNELNIQPYYFLAWTTGSFPAVNGSFSASADWSTLQVALESVGTNPTPTPAAPCAGPTPPAALAPYACARWGPSQW